MRKHRWGVHTHHLGSDGPALFGFEIGWAKSRLDAIRLPFIVPFFCSVDGPEDAT